MKSTTSRLIRRGNPMGSIACRKSHKSANCKAATEWQGGKTVKRMKPKLVERQFCCTFSIYDGKQRDIMRSPETVLNNLSKHSCDLGYKYERLYRLLFNEEMFFLAYQRIYAKQGNMTPGTNGRTVDQMSIQRIERLIDALKTTSPGSL